jgi:chromate transporter
MPKIRRRSRPGTFHGRTRPGPGASAGVRLLDFGMTDASPARETVTGRVLFWGFLKIGISGFGGVMPFAHRMIVERQRWLTETEFTESLSLAQFLHGPNIVNLSVIIGRRFGGPTGAVAASLGLMLMPLVIVLLLAMLFAEFAHVDAVRNACAGVSAAASGLILSVALKMARPMLRAPLPLGLVAITFAAIGLLRLPLLWSLAVVAPASIALAWWKMPR